MGVAAFLTTSLMRQSRVPAYSTSTICVGVWPLGTTPKLISPGFRTTSERALALTWRLAVETYSGPTLTYTVTALGPVKRRASMVMSSVPVSCGWITFVVGVAVTQPQETRTLVISRGTA